MASSAVRMVDRGLCTRRRAVRPRYKGAIGSMPGLSLAPVVPAKAGTHTPCPVGYVWASRTFFAARPRHTTRPDRSRHSRFSFSMSRIFQSRFHFFNCFSRVMASMGVAKLLHMHATMHAMLTQNSEPRPCRCCSRRSRDCWLCRCTRYRMGALARMQTKYNIGCASSRGHGAWSDCCWEASMKAVGMATTRRAVLAARRRCWRSGVFQRSGPPPS